MKRTVPLLASLILVGLLLIGCPFPDGNQSNSFVRVVVPVGSLKSLSKSGTAKPIDGANRTSFQGVGKSAPAVAKSGNRAARAVDGNGYKGDCQVAVYRNGRVEADDYTSIDLAAGSEASLLVEPDTEYTLAIKIDTGPNTDYAGYIDGFELVYEIPFKVPDSSGGDYTFTVPHLSASGDSYYRPAAAQLELSVSGLSASTYPIEIINGSNASVYTGTIAINSSGQGSLTGFPALVGNNYAQIALADSVGKGVTYLIIPIGSAGLRQVKWGYVPTSTVGNTALQASAYYGGNSYAAGYIFGSGSVVIAGQTINTLIAGGANPLVIRYNSAGAIANYVTSGSGSPAAAINAMCVGGTDIYVAGNMGSGTLTIGGQTATLSSAYASNIFIAKFNSSLTCQWIKTLAASPPGGSDFKAIAWDGTRVWAAGYGAATSAFDFGSGQTATGGNATENAILVGYDSSGNAVKAFTNTGTARTMFKSLTRDSAGNIIAGGYCYQNTVNFGGSPFTNPTANATWYRPMLAKFSTSSVIWAKTIAAGSDVGEFRGLACDSADNIYAVGVANCNGLSINFGNGLPNTHSDGTTTAIIAKYTSSGLVQWARTTSVTTRGSGFNAVTIDSAGTVYCAGYLNNSSGIPTNVFGPGVSVTSLSAGNNVVVVAYDSNGMARWGKGLVSQSNPSYQSQFNAIHTDGTILYMVGYQAANITFNYGDGTILTGSSGADQMIMLAYH